MNVVKKCGFCQQTAELMCSRCLEMYCSVECQIRDWSDHKKWCIAVPKLYPNESYVNVLTGGVAPQLQSPLVDQTSSRMLQNYGRSLKPLRRPNIPLGTVEAAANREATMNLSNGNHSYPKENNGSDGPKPPQNVTITIQKDCEQRFSKMKIQEVSSVEPTPAKKPTSPEVQKPQSLAKLKLEIIKNHQQMAKVASNSTPTDSGVVANSQPKPWLLHFPLEKKEGELFEAIVQYVVPDQPKSVWVILACHEAECDKLLRDIHGQLNPKGESIKFDQIQVDEIYAAPYEQVYYRVVVLSKVPEKNMVKVRLIDYGDILTLPSSELRAPLLLMKNLRAFAFQIEIQNLNQTLELSERIRVKLIRSQSDRMIVELEQTASTEYLLDLLGSSEEQYGGGGILAILSSRKALVMLSSAAVKPIMKSLYTQLPEAAPKFPLVENPKVGDLVCVDSFGVGWSRGLIVEQHEDNRLVYTVDNGTIDLVIKGQDIRELSDDYKQKPHLVLQMDIFKIVMNEQEFKRMCYLPSFAFSYERVAYDKERRSLKAVMKDAEGTRLLAEVEFSDFVCDLKRIGIHYWPQTPQDKCVVRITSVLDVSTVIICPHDKINIYTDLLQTTVPALKRLSAPPSANEVIVGVDDIMMPYRARVLKAISPTEIELLDLDNGCIKKVPFGNLYGANVFVSNLPVFTMKVQIRDINVSAIKDQANILDQLALFKAEKRNLKLLFDGGSYMYGVKLLDINTNRSLATILMENHDKKLREAEEAAKKKRDQEQEAARQKAVAEAHAKAERERLERERKAAQEAADAKAKQEAAVAKAKQEKQAREEEEERKRAAEAKAAAVFPAKFTVQNLPLVTLPTGKGDVKLTILDDGDLNQGALTVCELTDENVKRYATLSEVVNKSAAAIGGDGYSPELDELCIAIFDADHLWYRAVCLQPQPDKNTFVVQFIDYGNVASVRCESIRRMTSELNFPCAAHTCAVKDVSKSLEKLAQQQSQLGYVIAKEIHSEGDIYSLKF